MSNYGGHQFNAGFGRPPYLPPLPPQPPAPGGGGSSRPFLMMLLILACLVLGVLLAWGIRERGERARLSQRNGELADANVRVLAKRSDLASFLTDQKTRLYRLAGHGDASGRSVTVAWREDIQSGVLIGDRMPLPGDDATYTLWHVDAAHAATRAGAFRPDPAGTFYDFRVTGPTRGTAGFKVSIETDPNAAQPGRIGYETD